MGHGPIRSMLKVRIIGSIVRRLRGSTFRCVVVADTTKLYIRRLRGGWRHGHPISKTSRHQVLRRALRPVLAIRGRRSRCCAAHGGGLFSFAAWAALLPCDRLVTHACRLSRVSLGEEE